MKTIITSTTMILLIAMSLSGFCCTPADSCRCAEKQYVEARNYYDKCEYELAVKPMQTAAEMGIAHAQFLLAEMYELGRGVEPNDSIAVKWYLKAAEQGHGQAMYRLSEMYATGKGVPEDPEIARKWLEDAIKAGYAEPGI